ncbi:ABC transporter family substrate-binding protein [soil metagenome]
MIRKKSALAAAAVLGAGLLALSACAAGGSDPGPSANADSLPAVGWKAVDPSTLKQGGTLNLAVSNSPSDDGNWNNNTAEGAEVYATQVEAPTYGTGITIKEDGSWEPNPDYATSIELTSEDPQVITVKLNDKAVWQDGTPITADDYEATWHALSGQDPAYNIASSAGFEQVTSFDKTDDYDFSFTVSPVYADWPNIMNAALLPAADANDPDAWNTKYVSTPVPSNGPFMFTSVDSAANTFVAEPNPNWWGDAPKLDKITFTVIDQETQAQSYANDEIDVVELATPDGYLSAQDKKGAEILRSGGLTYSQVTFNGTVAPLDDPKVRQALAHGIDRDIIGQAANEPLGAPSSPVGNYVLMPGQDGYTDTTGDTLAYDKDKAMSLLEDAGWKHADGKWTKDGDTLEVSVIVPQGSASNELRAQQIQASLKDIDVKVTIDESPSADYFQNISDGKYEMATFGWQGTAFNISSSESLFSPAQKPGDDLGQNYAFISDDKLEDLWAKANVELDPAKRLDYVTQINDVIAEYVPMLPLYAYPNVFAVDSDVANYGPATFESVDWTAVGYTK